MKLTAKQTERTAAQIGAQALPDDHPVVPELTGLFGEHTFFLHQDGLEIVELAEPGADGARVTLVNLASWADGDRTRLAPHAPEVTALHAMLEADGAG